MMGAAQGATGATQGAVRMAQGVTGTTQGAVGVCGLDATVQMLDASFSYGLDEERDELGGKEGPAGDVAQRAVDGVSLRVEPGSCLVLCGASGSGKSTVLRMIEGLAGSFFPGALSGRVMACGCDVQSWDARARAESMGVVMQDPRSQFFMGTVFDEIAFTSENLGVSPDKTVERVRGAAALCRVDALLGEELTQLSSGQKQRVALAAAIAKVPRLLVLDEPTSNLDEEGARVLVDILADLKQKGIALVVSEHRLQPFVQIADSYLCLRGGRVVARWSSKEFRSLSASEAAALGLRHPGMTRRHACPTQDVTTGERGWTVVDLSYEYPSTGRGVHGASAHFAAGAVTALCGPNGVGKTTLACVLCGVLRERTGHVLCDGRPVSRRDRRRSSCFVMQDVDYQLYAGSVADELVLGRRVDDALRSRVWAALDAFGLRDLVSCHPLALSGGQKQRVILAAAYCSDANLVVLDEPTSGLDGTGLRQVCDWCRTLADAGKSVVIITHDRLLVDLAADVAIELGRA